MKTIIVIPARLASTRLPRKLLLDETGKTLLQHTYEAAVGSQKADRVIVAADAPEIVSAVESFGGEVVLTNIDHVCGTDRVAEVAGLAECDIVVNVQGDEPEIDPASIDLLIGLLEGSRDVKCATLATPIYDLATLEDPACVKVVMDQNGRALYFSRSVIPYPRDGYENWLTRQPESVHSSMDLDGLKHCRFWQHVGLYGYRKDFLLEISQRPAVALEKIESLEQLRILDAGESILVGKIRHRAAGIDTPADYAAFVSRQGC